MAPASGGWCVYMLRCRDGSLYTGITTDLKRRTREHEMGRGAKYTRGRGPFELCGFKDGLTREEALRLEWRIKSLPAAKKKHVGLIDDGWEEMDENPEYRRRPMA
ncbi:MAG: GIY-YIG nuclease family protein [Peptococcaceae bacterium]|nr:GIY-YIG nuclease family protein [Peptococcaceae bacterium]